MIGTISATFQNCLEIYVFSYATFGLRFGKFVRIVKFLKCGVSEIFWFFGILTISQKTPQLGQKWIWSNRILAVDTSINEVTIVFIDIIWNSFGCSKWDKFFTKYSNYNFGFIPNGTPCILFFHLIGNRFAFKNIVWSDKFNCFSFSVNRLQ